MSDPSPSADAEAREIVAEWGGRPGKNEMRYLKGMISRALTAREAHGRMLS